MWSSDSDPELATATATSASQPPFPPPALRSRHRHRHRRKKSSAAVAPPREAEAEPEPEVEAEDVWRGAQWETVWPRHPKPVLLAEEDDGAGEGSGVGRSRSLTDDDLEELKGCADLGFGFSYDEIPELRGTLPALELCYSMTQRLLDEHPQAQSTPEAAAATPSAPSPPVTNWKISSPGDSPDEVKARLKYWAQAVACTVRLCS
ncbi:uncharacterized protein LOC133904328 [Phragmites australis]|uniref:uncharacterized protein LOC133904328 n=1 Tax=Phragmites australis TaxID=29695 RepID=UPI002D775AF2|nr:uncharacterized protein LOC133904328 [Phragmites australis]